MELRQLEYFCKIAETGSINEAARRMNMSQPPLSYQMRQLEDELNVRLFQRSSRGVELTEAGSEFVKIRVIQFHGEWASRLPDLDDAVVDKFVYALARMQETMPGIEGVKSNGKRK